MTRHEDETPWLADLLRAEAARHQPDRDRILAAIDQGRGADRHQVGEPDAAPLGSVGEGRRGSRRWDRFRRRPAGRPAARPAAPPAGRGAGRPAAPPAGRPAGRGAPGRRLAWPVVAAGFAVLTVATVAGARVLAPGEAGPVAGQPGTATLGPAVTVAGSPGPTGTAPAPTPTADATVPTRTGGPSPSAPAPTTAGRRPTLSDAVAIQVTPGRGGPLTLPRSAADRDWIVVGARQDGVLVRAKKATRPLGTVTVSGYGPSVVDGPYAINWQGGLPEQSRAQDVTWQSITAVDGRLRVTVPARGDRFTVDLYAGTVRTTGQVSVQVAGSSAAPVQGLLAACGVDVCPDVVSVTVDGARLAAGGASGDVVIDLGPAHPGQGLGLGLAAVVLR